MIKYLQEHLAFIQLQGGNNALLEWIYKFNLELIQKRFPGIWVRNSYYFHAHHPLASDIDLSFMGEVSTAREIFKAIENIKIFGELNFYPSAISSELLTLINPYELERDPILARKVAAKTKNEIQKEVFLFRQIIGDQYWLKKMPIIRIKKWDYLLNILNEKIQTLTLSQLLSLSSFPWPLHNYLENSSTNLFDHFKQSPLRSFFPHKHIWDERDLPFLSSLSLTEKNFLIEQVKWEFWGIGTQLHWIDLAISYEFLERLKKVVIHIGATALEVQAMNKILDFILKLSQATR